MRKRYLPLQNAGGRVVRSHRSKLAYAVALAIDELIRKPDGLPIFATFTFQENLTDKGEAQGRWRRLKERLRRQWPHTRGVGVWQRQKRGAWHLHYVFSQYLDVVLLREAALQCGFGPMLNLRYIDRGVKSKAIWSFRRVTSYMTRYVLRDVDEIDKGVRVVDYHGPHARIASVRFSWARGFARLYRAGRTAWSEMFAEREGQPGWDSYWFLIRLGFETLSLQDRERSLLESDAVCKWWNPEAYPF